MGIASKSAGCKADGAQDLEVRTDKMAKPVIAGLDPATHLLRKNLAKRDGYAGQARV